MRFGSYLKSLRTRAGLTQRQLAQKCGLSGGYITQLEKEKTDPPTRQICRALARALGIEGRDLWKYAFTGRLERWVRKEGYKRIPSGLTSAFFDSLDSYPNPGLAATTKSAPLRSCALEVASVDEQGR
jgi:transcriptional regulator with XRE-family HTH domain